MTSLTDRKNYSDPFGSMIVDVDQDQEIAQIKKVFEGKPEQHPLRRFLVCFCIC